MKKDESKNTVRKFAIASFLNDLGSDMIYPIWPLFVTEVLGANMTILGLIDGLGDTVVSISQAISGYLSDRLKKRKIFIWLGYLMGSLSRIGYAFTIAWQPLFFFRILDRGGKIRSSPRDAAIADLSTTQNMGANFGFLRAMDNLGAVFGILVCIAFYKLLGYKILFLIAAIPSIIAAMLIFGWVNENKEFQKHAFKGLSFKHLNKNLIILFLLNGIFSLGFFSYSFILIYTKKLGFDTGWIPIFYLIFTITASAVSMPFGKLSDVIGRKKVMLISFLLWIFICLLFIVISYLSIFNLSSIFIIFALYGIQKGALDPVQKTMVSELAPIELRASTLGAFQMVQGLIALPASFIAGTLWDTLNPLAPFYFSAILSFIAIFLLYFIKENKREAA
ncbi:MAG: MFS transporter [Spirochaetia bacterium]|nr:MFS transporter [Spirochaetia bacterium]